MINKFSKGIQTLLELLFEDQCDILRSIDVKQSNGSIRREFSKIYDEIPCRLSRIVSRRVAFDRALPQTTLQSDARLYLVFDSDIQIGDCIDITADEQQYQVTEVFRYPSHIECSLKKVVEA